MSELQNYRDQIDKIDTKLLELLAQRFEEVEKVGEYKKNNGLPPLQPGRWLEVLESRKQKAIKLGIDPEFIEILWNEIHKYALKIEKAITI